MSLIGWSTGSLLPVGSKTDYVKAVEEIKKTPFTAIEFSVLREHELDPFFEQLPDLDVSGFDYVSFHVCKLVKLSELTLVRRIEPVLERGWNVINHPDLMTDRGLWQSLGSQICIENMDGSKPFGNNLDDMKKIFDEIPEASMCFDIAHAKRMDPTMLLGREMCNTFGDRIKEIHMSEVDKKFLHRPMDIISLRRFQLIADVLPPVPIILECDFVGSIEDEVQFLSENLPAHGIPLQHRGIVPHAEKTH